MNYEKDGYIMKMHRFGRIAGVIALATMIGIPLIVCVIYDCMPTAGALFQSCAALLAIYITKSLSEVLSFSPLLGSASYITYITGNADSIKVPCALNAMEITDSALGTERGDAISAVGVAAGSLTVMVILTIGVILLKPLEPVLALPVVATAKSYMLPSLFGCMMIQNTMNSKSGDYKIKNKWLLLVIPIALLLAFNYGVASIKGKEGYVMLAMIPINILIALSLYKLKVVQAEFVGKKKPEKAQEKGKE